MAQPLPAVLTAEPFRQLFAQLAQNCARQTPERTQGQVTGALKPLFAEAKTAIRARFEAGGKPTALLGDTCILLDRTITLLHDLARLMLAGEGKLPISVIATGGYGRKELFPFSDIDISVLYDPREQKAAEQLAGFISYVLWDMGLTVGHTLRTVDETLAKAEEDFTIRTALLDARLICGSKSLYQKCEERFWQAVTEGGTVGFVEAKLTERDDRHKRVGDSRYVLEPNLKEGKGGLRDLHTLYWLARYIYRIRSARELVGMHVLTKQEYTGFHKAAQFLAELRIHLHLLAGRPEERLTFDMQRAIAERMGFEDDSSARAVEKFMKKYFQVARTVGNLTRSICAVLEEDKKRKPKSLQRVGGDKQRIGAFVLDGERLGVDDEKLFEQDPARLIELFMISHQSGHDIHPRALQLVSRSLSLIGRDLLKDTRACGYFMDILLSRRNPEPMLRRMNEAGVLGRFIPDFGHVIGQMQFDMYHVFTVDEHTIMALGILHGIETGKYTQEIPLATRIFPQILSRRTLFLALLCHDIAKGRGGDHSVLGEDVARKLALRMGCSEQEAETAGWLVRQHLLMSRTAFKRDINDPQTLRAFVDIVQSPERLRLLLLLTVADIRAVGPQVWNGWKGALLRELYYRAEALMLGNSATLPGEDKDQSLRADLARKLPGWSEQEIGDYVNLGSGSFWYACDADAHAHVARMVKELPHLPFPLKMETRTDTFRAITEIIFCLPDQHGLFSKLSGAMAVCGINIVGAKIFTLKNGVAVDMFQVQDTEGKAFDRPDRIARLAVVLEQTLTGGLDLDAEIARSRKSYPSRLDVFKVPPSVFIDNAISETHTVIEVGGRDRIGFLYSVTRVLSEQGLTISSAHISTYGERAVDVFYVKDVFGMKIHHEGKLREIRERLSEALGAAAQPEKTKKAG